MECVTQLAFKSEEGVSDADFMCEALRAEGYWAHTCALQATDFGAFGARERQYCAGLVGVKPPHSEVAYYFNSIRTGLKTLQTFDLDTFFVLRKAIAREMPTRSSFLSILSVACASPSR